MIIAKLTAAFTAWGVPEGLRKPLAWIALLAAALALLWAAKAAYDASVIDDHEAGRTARTIEARDTAANERAQDAIRNAEAERKLNDAIDNAPSGAIDPAMLAVNCERLRQQPGGLSERGRRICGD